MLERIPTYNPAEHLFGLEVRDSHKPDPIEKILNQLKSEVLPAKPIRLYNLLFQFVFQDPKTPLQLSTVEPLRIVVEEYSSDSGKEFIVFWAIDKAFIGHGSTRDDALMELAENLVHDYLFYSSKRKRELTGDAQATKQLLQSYLTYLK